MTCPDAEQLEFFAGGDASSPESRLISDHLSTCAACRNSLDEIRHNLDFAASLRSSAPAPRELGPYTVIRELGRGGMGVVFEARQSEPERRIAVKVLRAVDPSSARRLQREAATLARLSHPAIAAVFDAGRDADGRPYLAMELVAGDRLTRHADAAGLDIRGRIELFLRVCEGVAAAHRQGVVHRDLKPSNILVTPEGHPKILDFGLARLLDDADASLVTEAGRIAGTIAYMSPEQARGEPADTRSDVYALGVVLYELLCKGLPYTVSAANLAASVRTVIEVEPVRPSTRARTLRGDLEAVMLKALDKDPVRRYQSVSAFAEDLHRVLKREPVTARVPTLAYQIRKLVARAPLASGLAAALVVLIVGLGIAMTALYLRATRAEGQAAGAAAIAREEADTAWATQEFLLSLFYMGDSTKRDGTPLTARDLVARGSERIADSLRDRPRVRTELLRSLGAVQGELGDETMAREHFVEALALAEDLREESPLAEARVLRDYGHFLSIRGDADGLDMLSRSVAIFDRENELDNSGARQAVLLLTQSLSRFNDPLETEPALREYVAFLERHPHHHRDLVSALNMLGGNLHRQGRTVEAIEVMRRAERTAFEEFGEQTAERAACLNNLASLLASAGERAEAIELAREGLAIRMHIFGDSNMVTASSMLILGRTLLAADGAAEALPHLTAAHRIWSGAFPASSSPVAESAGALGECLLALGRLDEAEPLLLASESSVAARATSSPEDRREGLERLVRLFEARGDEPRAAEARGRLAALAP